MNRPGSSPALSKLKASPQPLPAPASPCQPLAWGSAVPLPRPLGPEAAPPSSRLLAWEGGQALSSDLGDSRVSEAQSQPRQPGQTRRGGRGGTVGTRKPFRGGAGIPAAFFLLLFRDPSLSPGGKGARPPALGL